MKTEKKIYKRTKKPLDALTVSNVLNESHFIDRIELQTGREYDRDAQFWYDLEEFIVEGLNDIEL